MLVITDGIWRQQILVLTESLPQFGKRSDSVQLTKFTKEKFASASPVGVVKYTTGFHLPFPGRIYHSLGNVQIQRPICLGLGS